MSKQVVGELQDWNDGETSGGGNDFMNLKEGNNNIRVFTNPYQFYVAWVRDTAGVNRKIRSSVENCPLVKAGYQPKPRWYVGVIDRSTGQPKILEIPSTVYGSIKNLINNPKWGNVKQYDLNILRKPKGTPPAQLYSVMPEPKEPLTKEEKEMIVAFNERVDIGKFTKPPTPEEVAEKLGVVLGEDLPRVAVGTKTYSTKKTEKPVLDEDFADFGDDDEL